jgi:hypothetical protein
VPCADIRASPTRPQAVVKRRKSSPDPGLGKAAWAEKITEFWLRPGRTKPFQRKALKAVLPQITVFLKILSKIS